MSDEYEKPTLTYIGNVRELQVDVPAQPNATYQVGDYVWARNTPVETAVRWLARIEGAHSVRSPSGRRWLVRIRRRQFWTSGPMHMYIDRRLQPEEVLYYRKQKLIPEPGAPL